MYLKERVCAYTYIFHVISDAGNKSTGISPIWELLAPRGYRFYMPGRVGPAWHDAYSVVHIQEFESASSHQTGKKVKGTFSRGLKTLR
jgi:hypothetical protein